MKIPLEITFRDVTRTESIENLIREKARKLDRICDHLTRCRVVVEKPHEHQRFGQEYRVLIEMTVPPGHDLVVKRKSTEGNMHDDLPVVLRDAFNAAQKRLNKLIERQRGDVKAHPEQEVMAVIDKIFPEDGYGFLRTADGREVYFHKNSIVHDDINQLDTGMGVRFVEEVGEQGAQASTVQVVDRPDPG